MWRPQPYPDNYVDESFLSSLRDKPPARPPSFVGLMQASLAITQQLCLVTIFSVVYYTVAASAARAEAVEAATGSGAEGIHQGPVSQISRGGAMSVIMASVLQEGTATPGAVELRYLGTANVAVFALGFLALATAASPLVAAARLPQVAKSCALFVGVLYLLSPALKSLTTSYADDAIVTLSVCLGLLHLYLHDYSAGDSGKGAAEDAAGRDGDSVAAGDSGLSARSNRPPTRGPQVPVAGTVSFNAAVFASTLLASRLRSTALAFSFLLFAVQTFAFAPVVLRRLRLAGGPLLHMAATAALFAATQAMLVNALGDSDQEQVGAGGGGGGGGGAAATGTARIAGRRSRVAAAAGFTWLALVVNVGGPAAFLALHGKKQSMSGPWDVKDVDIAAQDASPRRRTGGGGSRGGDKG